MRVASFVASASPNDAKVTLSSRPFARNTTHQPFKPQLAPERDSDMGDDRSTTPDGTD